MNATVRSATMIVLLVLATDRIDAQVHEDLGGLNLTSGPAVVSRGQRQDAFYRGPNGHLWTSSWPDKPGGVWWSAPADLGGTTLSGEPAAVSRDGKRIDVFYRGPNNHLWTSSWPDKPGGVWWGAPADLGGVELTSAPAVAARDANQLDVFYRGPNNHLWKSSWPDKPGSVWWGAPADLGGVELTSAPAAAARNANHLDVFYRGPNNHLWTSSWPDKPGSIWWGAPADLGGVELTSAPAAAARNANHLDIFYRGPNNHLWTSSWPDKPGSIWWSAPRDLGGHVTSSPGVALADGVLYRGSNDHLWRYSANGSPRPISVAGVYKDGEDSPFLVAQGMSGSTLVAGKELLFRIWVDAPFLGRVAKASLTVKKPGSGNTVFEADQLFKEAAAPLGPSVGIIVPGRMLPSEGDWGVTFSLRDGNGVELVHSTSPPLRLLPTVDMRFLVTYLVHPGTFTSDATWDLDVRRSVRRLASMYPVRDGVDESASAGGCNGIRYTIGTPCDGYVDGYYSCVYDQTRNTNKQLGANPIDITIEYRPGLYAPKWNPPGDPGPGGNSARPPAPYSDLRRASCVSGNWNDIEMTAACFMQETGHNYGLEPPGSPHYQDVNDPGHSKDPIIADAFAFDFVNRRPFPQQVGDTMNNLGGGAFKGVDAVGLNPYDWEYFRQQLVAQAHQGATGTGGGCN